MNEPREILELHGLAHDSPMARGIAELVLESFYDLKEPSDMDIDEFLHGLNGALVAAAVEGEQVIAVGSLRTSPDGEKGRISNVAVAEHRRREGLATEVVTFLEDRARESGVVDVSAIVRSSPPAAAEAVTGLCRELGYEHRHNSTFGKMLASAAPETTNPSLLS